jgi:molybdopterin converting factor subunit 1
MIVRIQLFAAAKERAGTDTVDMTVPDSSRVRDLHAALLSQVPALNSLSGSLLWAVNHRYAGPDDTVSAGDSVACFPPVSGG